MNIKPKLAVTQARDDRRTGFFFWCIWGFLALTSAVFGYENVSDLFGQLVGLIPLSDQAHEVVSGILGAVASVLVLDWGYRAWENARIDSAKSAEQTTVAKIAENGSFWVSLYFTAWVLFDLLLSHWVGDEIISYLGQVGAGAFVLISCLHGWAARSFRLNDPERARAIIDSELHGARVTQELTFRRQVMTQSLLEATGSVEDTAAAVTRVLTDQFKLALLDETMGAVERDEERSAAIQDRLNKMESREAPPLPAPSPGTDSAGRPLPPPLPGEDTSRDIRVYVDGNQYGFVINTDEQFDKIIGDLEIAHKNGSDIRVEMVDTGEVYLELVHPQQEGPEIEEAELEPVPYHNGNGPH